MEVEKMRLCCSVRPLVRAAFAEFIGTFILVVSSFIVLIFKTFSLVSVIILNVYLGHR
jgi:hypothetical protein